MNRQELAWEDSELMMMMMMMMSLCLKVIFLRFAEIKHVVTADELLHIFIELNGLDQDVEVKVWG